MIFSYSQFDSFFKPNRLVWLEGDIPAPPEASTTAEFDTSTPDGQAALRLAAETGVQTGGDATAGTESTEQSETPDHAPEHKETVPVPVLELVESGLLRAPATTADLNALLENSSHQLTDAQRTFVETVLHGGESGIATLNLQIAEYKKTKEEFSAKHMRDVVTRSHENLVEQGYGMAKDLAGKGLDALTKGAEKYPGAMIALAALGLYFAITNREKFGTNLLKWGAGLTAAALIAPAAVDLLKNAGVPGIGARDAAESEAKEKEAKMDFLTGNLPPSFIAELRTKTADAGIKNDDGLLGFYELCQMSVSQFADEMLKKDEDVSDADIGVNLGDQSYKLTGKQRYDLGKELIRTFGFDPDSPSDLQAFKDKFGKDQKKLWMVAKVLPSMQSPESAAA